METVVLNNEMQLSYPDSFHVMSEEELSKMTFFGEAPGWCISDPERHIDVSVSWKKTNGLFAKILNTREIAKNMEAQIRKPMGQYGYRLDSFLEKELGGRRADGYLYAYEVQGTGMAGESLYLKNGNTFYYIHCYFRDAMRDDSLPVLDEIFGSVRWK